MTVSEIHKAFKVQMDKNAEAVAFGGCPAFLPEEIDLFLNQAFTEIISNKFTGQNVLQTPFEGSVKRVADLEGLVKTDSNVSLTLTSNTNILTLENFSNDNSRMFYVTSVLHFNNQSSTCTLVSHEDARKFLRTYNNDPWIDTPVVTLEDNQLKVMIDTYTMEAPYTIDLTYVSFPPMIDSNSPTTDITVVPDRVLYEIINRAVLIALDNVESRRVETKSQINNLQE